MRTEIKQIKSDQLLKRSLNLSTLKLTDKMMLIFLGKIFIHVCDKFKLGTSIQLVVVVEITGEADVLSLLDRARLAVFLCFPYAC